jgi:hypothetical protein
VQNSLFRPDRTVVQYGKVCFFSVTPKGIQISGEQRRSIKYDAKRSEAPYPTQLTVQSGMDGHGAMENLNAVLAFSDFEHNFDYIFRD